MLILFYYFYLGDIVSKTYLLVIDFQEGSLQHKVALLMFLKDFE